MISAYATTFLIRDIIPCDGFFIAQSVEAPRAVFIGSSFHFQNASLTESSNVQPFSDGNTYHFKIIVQGNVFKVYYNDISSPGDISYLKAEDTSNSFPTGTLALQASVGADYRSEVYFDNVVVREIEEDPVVILPGLMGSWCKEAIFGGVACSGEWTALPEPLDPYDSLISSIQTASDVDEVYVWYYDWRKPISDLADELDEYINNNVLDGKSDYTKVRLVGHSYGGLVSSHYAIDHSDKVDKVVTVGSPHQGAVKAYSVWQAGTVWDSPVFFRAVLHMLLSSRRGSFATDKDVIQNEFLSVKDVLPTFNYLKDEAGNVIAESSMNQRNTNLASQFTDLANIKDLLTTIVGVEQNSKKDTLKNIVVRNADADSQAKGWWEDGQPVSNEYSEDGDLTVLKTSAKYDDAASKPEVNTDHTGLVTEAVGIDAILDALESTSSGSIADTVMDDEVEIEGEMYRDSDNDGIIILEDVVDSEAKVTLKGTGDGDFDLDLIQLHSNGDQSNTYPGTIHNNEVLVYLFNLNPEDPDGQPKINTNVTAVDSSSDSSPDSGSGFSSSSDPKSDMLVTNQHVKVTNLDIGQNIKDVLGEKYGGDDEEDSIKVTNLEYPECGRWRFWVGLIKGLFGIKINAWLNLFRLLFRFPWLRCF